MQIIPFCDSLLEAAGELTLKVWGNEIPVCTAILSAIIICRNPP